MTSARVQQITQELTGDPSDRPTIAPPPSAPPLETPHGNTLEAWCRENQIAREHVIGPSRTKWASGHRRRALAHVHELHPEVSLVELGRLFGGRDHSTVLYLLDRSTQGKGAAALRQRTAKRVAAGKAVRGTRKPKRGRGT